MQHKNYKATLYPDFKLTTENCDVEPIHRPIAIQGHGYLLAFDQNTPDYLLAMSENVPGLLDMTADALWQTPVKNWTSDVIINVYDEMAHHDSWDSIDPIPIEIKGKYFNLIRHIHDGYRFLEIEPKVNNEASELSTFRAIRMVTEPFNKINDLDKLYNQFASLYKKVSGYDRVMVYQFDNDHHGHVVGEARESHLESFLGLHYPATDIPKMARDLFLLNKSRIIHDVHLENNWLRFNPGIQGAVPHLDLTYSQTRATSPIHIEYLKNMGVMASLTLAIIVESELWGLIACHNYRPHFISYEMRKTGELIANAFSQRIVEITRKEYQKKAKYYFDLKVDILKKITLAADVGVQLVDKKPDLTEIGGADGCAVITSNAGMYSFGTAPGKTALIRIKEWLFKEGLKDVFFTNHLIKDLPSDISIPQEIGGMMSVCVSTWEDTFLMWFRKSQKETSHWGGDPSKPYEVDFQANGELRLSPRKSFEKWKVQVDTKSKQWDKINIDIARQLMEGLLKKEVERQVEKAKIIKNDYEQLTYVASHDLQEPLRTVTNYLDLLSETLENDQNEALKHYLLRVNLAARRMKKLIKDMLDYSRLGNNREIEWVPVNEVLGEIMEDLDLLVRETRTTIDIKDLPDIKGDRTEVKQLFQNLISNAIKYRREEALPLIRISAKHAGNHWIYSVEDNGIGMEEAHFDRVFLLFQRLHGKDEYDGTGIGLAHCRKIIDHLDGKIWITSKVGTGSTFLFSLHELIVKTNDKQT
ncbi:GAF domain-containing protein [Fulvivirga sp. M361]|uniref:ATP-binding protein n=1 Tax=Fulvivirga sp. M361 TaxID=2594266 RepID=UPI00117B58AD|nr:ATP-binding protein [Fulvivirga sp. M361]TRX47191.1 GAF domain-containing protein [Fulvivirga sp. M361]